MPALSSTGRTISSNDSNYNSSGTANNNIHDTNQQQQQQLKKDIENQHDNNQSENQIDTDQLKVSKLPSYPLLDTFSLLCVLVIFPHWFSTILSILYVFMGNPEFLESILSFILKHKLNKLSSNSSKNSVSIVGDISLISFILYLLIDSIVIFAIFYFFPAFVPYIILLSKSFIASNLTSLKNRYILDAFSAFTLLLILENSMLYIIKHFEIFRGDSVLSLTSTLSSTDFLYPLYYTSTTSFTKTLIFYLTFHKLNGNSSLMFQMEYALQFFHTTLSFYIIMHNLNPVLRRFPILNKLYSYFELLMFSNPLSDNESNNNSIDFINLNLNNKTKYQTVFHIPKEISSSTLPTVTLKTNIDYSDIENETDIDIDSNSSSNSNSKSNPVSKSKLNSNLNSGSNSTKQNENSNEETLNTSNNDDKVPMWFPEDDRVINMNDVSSPSFVVAQNFENFCKMIWTSSAHLLSSNNNSFPISQDMLHSTSSNPVYQFNQNDNQNNNLSPSTTTTPSSFTSLSNNNNNNNNSNNNNNNINTFSSNSINSFSNILSSSPSLNSSKYKNFNSHLLQSKRVISKSKNILISSDKKAKLNLLKYQQPLWLFLNAARTMFSRQDYYSGDYYSQNAIVTTGYGMDDYARNTNSSSQCFIWFTGETTLAFELHNISLEQLLIKVNGIIWEHVSSCAFFGREMIIINGLSPLSQYDIDFVKITLNGELIHLTTTTVSTVFQNKTVTESNISSPLATLQRSVVTTQEAIEREKARLKKMKTDWRKKSSQIKSEIENLNNRSNFSDESRNYKKLDSLRQTVAKSDIEITNISKKSEEIRLLQTEIEEKYLDAKRLYETELRSFNKFENETKNDVRQLEKNVESLLSEKNQLLMKKEKIISKRLRIHHDVELLTNELKTLKKTEIALRVERRKFRSIQREEKYKLLVNDIKKFERQLRGRNLNSF